MTQLVGKKLVLVLLLCCDCGLVRALHALRRRQRAAATVREKLPRPRRQGANLGQSTSWLLHHLGHRFADALNQSIEFRHKQTCLAAFPLHSWLSAACRRRARLEQVALSRSQVSFVSRQHFSRAGSGDRCAVESGRARLARSWRAPSPGPGLDTLPPEGTSRKWGLRRCLQAFLASEC